jgi:hypothetical protein
VKISLYDVNGKEVSTITDNIREAGYYKDKIDGNDLSSGIYFCRIETFDYTKTIRIILLK